MDRLKAMETFVRIARAANLSDVAAELNTSRSLVSRHLKELEEHLGVRLFNRTTRQIALTEEGAEYLDFCTEMLARLDEGESAIARQCKEPRGTIRLIVSTSFGNKCLAPILVDFLARYRSMQVSVTIGETRVSPRNFIEKGYDAVVCMHPLEDSALLARKIADLVWVPCATPEYLARHGRPELPADLAGHNCIFNGNRAPSGIWRFRKGAEPHDVRIAGSFLSNSIPALHAATLAHLGIAILPSFYIHEDLAAGALVPLLPGFSLPVQPISIVYPDARIPQMKLRLLADFIQKALKAQPWAAAGAALAAGQGARQG